MWAGESVFRLFKRTLGFLAALRNRMESLLSWVGLGLRESPGWSDVHQVNANSDLVPVRVEGGLNTRTMAAFVPEPQNSVSSCVSGSLEPLSFCVLRVSVCELACLCAGLLKGHLGFLQPFISPGQNLC